MYIAQVDAYQIWENNTCSPVKPIAMFFRCKPDRPHTRSDRKWFTRLVVAGIIYTQLKELDLKYPTLSKEQHQGLLNAKKILESQK
ncbi:hypothetical protein [Pseudanabaena sp. lw0831]|uniref:hypothetical protein n=1 Tax=Pseudanabaena sp. lw0831 TaxID=1357935 RepID=UPI001915B9D8|nr:hypothetical protein [Pseudanabaena sp. lw0831]